MIDTDVEISAGFFARWMDAEKLATILKQFGPGVVVAPNRVGNLSVLKGPDNLGYIDFNEEIFEVNADEEECDLGLSRTPHTQKLAIMKIILDLSESQIEKMVYTLESTDDEGPGYESWQSKELEGLASLVKEAVKAAQDPQPIEDSESVIMRRGARLAWGHILRECLMNLGYDDSDTMRQGWIIEREALILALRELCGEFGDNDWAETLHMADVIEKHLARHLYSEQARRNNTTSQT